MSSRTDGRIARGVFLVERYWPGITRAEFDGLAAVLDELGRAAGDGDPAALDHLGSVLVTADEVVLSLFRAPSADAIRAGHASRNLVADRILEVIGTQRRTG